MLDPSPVVNGISLPGGTESGSLLPIPGHPIAKSIGPRSENPAVTNFTRSPLISYDPSVAPPSPRPGLAKTRELPLLQKQQRQFWQSNDLTWRDLLEKADVVSEGAIRNETDGPVYYGSTIILLFDSTHGGRFAPSERATLFALLSHDPHARVRVVRMACLEAQLRARRGIGSIRAEFAVRLDPRGLRVDVDVEAPVLVDAAFAHAPHPSSTRPRR